MSQIAIRFDATNQTAFCLLRKLQTRPNSFSLSDISRFAHVVELRMGAVCMARLCEVVLPDILHRLAIIPGSYYVSCVA